MTEPETDLNPDQGSAESNGVPPVSPSGSPGERSNSLHSAGTQVNPLSAPIPRLLPPPPAAVIVNGKGRTEFTVDLEKELEEERKKRKEREQRVSELEDENRQLKSIPKVPKKSQHSEWHLWNC